MGTKKSGDAALYIRAFDAYRAMRQALDMPGVKSDRFASVTEILYEEYRDGLAKNMKEGYLKTERNACAKEAADKERIK